MLMRFRKGCCVNQPNSIELPAEHALFLDRVLDSFAEIVQMSTVAQMRTVPHSYLWRTHLQGFPSHQTVAMLDRSTSVIQVSLMVFKLTQLEVLTSSYLDSELQLRKA